MPKLKGLNHVVLHVRELDKMAAFYQDALGLVKNYEIAGRMTFMTSDPEREDHELALAKGREGDSNIFRTSHGAWRASLTSRRSMRSSRPRECRSIAA